MSLSYIKKIKSCSIYAALLLFIISSNLFSAPLRFHPVTVTQPDGTVLNLFASGDEFHNWLHDEDEFTIMQDEKGYYVYAVLSEGKLTPSGYIVGQVKPKELSITPGINILQEEYSKKRKAFYHDTPKSTVAAPTHGLINNLVIFIRFSDETQFTGQLSFYDEMFNRTGSGVNSMYNYYKEVSYNKLEIYSHLYPNPVGPTIESYQDNYPRSYYMPYSSTNTNGYQNDTERRNREHILLKKACEYIADKIPQSLDLDADGDGYVDNVCFIVTGNTTAWNTLLWPHRWALYSQTAYIHGKRVYDFNFQLQASLQSSGVGVLCHEMFHSLGAPDLYHYTSNGIAPVGSWDIMENDLNPPQHMTAYMKYRYGDWIDEIPEITESGTYELNPLIDSLNNVFMLRSPQSSTEYFVLEYRKRIPPFESSLPGDGLLVFRINTLCDGQGNADGPPDEVYLFRPNGTLTANGSTGIANFNAAVGRTAFNQSTNPYPFLSNGKEGGIHIFNIGDADSTLKFSVNILNSLITISPNGNEFLNIGDVKTITWSSFGSTTKIKIEYSTDAGENWLLIADQVTASLGVYDWTIPNTISYNCKLKISDVINPGLYDESNGLFAIIPAGNYNVTFVDSIHNTDVRTITVDDGYAYAACGNSGLKIYNLIEQKSLSLVSELQTPGSARMIAIKDNYAFIATYTKGVRVVDISNPTSPTEVSYHNTNGFLSDIAIKDNHAFVAGGYKGIRALDISNISQIVEVGSFVPTSYSVGITIKENIAYIANDANGVRILDISNPTNISEISFIDPPGIEADVAISDTLLFVASKNGGVNIVGVGNPTEPVLLASYPINGIALSVSVKENFLYVASESNGVRIIDISNPLLPVEIGFYDTPGYNLSATAFNNLVLAADNGTGLFLLKNDLLTSVSDDLGFEKPSNFSLSQNYPNPFNPATSIRFSIPQDGLVTMKVYNTLGQEVTTLVNEYINAGNHVVNFNAAGLTSGIYFYTITSNNFISTKKMLLLK